MHNPRDDSSTDVSTTLESCDAVICEAGTRLVRAVTIDFHDTLFQCDEWFQLEVRDLPVRFLNWYAYEYPGGVGPVDVAEVSDLYRRLRRSAIETGVEIDSIGCVEQILSMLDLTVDRDVVTRGVDALMRDTLPHTQPRPGVIDLIRSLRAAGMKLGVISNAIHHPFLEWTLDRFGMSPDFDLVLSSAKAGFYKSRVELYQMAAQELRVPARETIHIGDSYRFDVMGASAAGMRTVWLNLNDESAGAVVPDLTVHSLEGLATELIARIDSTFAPKLGLPDAL